MAYINPNGFGILLWNKHEKIYCIVSSWNVSIKTPTNILNMRTITLGSGAIALETSWLKISSVTYKIYISYSRKQSLVEGSVGVTSSVLRRILYGDFLRGCSFTINQILWKFCNLCKPVQHVFSDWFLQFWDSYGHL